MGGLPCGSCYKGRAVSAVRSRYFVHQNGKVAFPTDLVLLPFGRMSFMLKKNVTLEIPYTRIHKVEIKEDLLNWRIELDTDDGLIALSAQQKELSEFRTSGTLSVGMSGFGSGIMGKGPLKTANWHRTNLDATLDSLKALSC